ncbi:MAG: hypothetical protein C4519_19035 [Desulfobacteraceae bacterium]|nr:MAG: hypothetical protein C4519_19035 [Desulfobacteraceae bacterium]
MDTTIRRRGMPPGKKMNHQLRGKERKEVFAAMPYEIHGTNGIERLIQKYKEDFRIPENLEHYSVEDYARAERGYIQFCLRYGGSGNERPFGNA